MNSQVLHGRTALVTGGSKGIGRETARLLASMGAQVYICGRDQDALTAAEGSLRTAGTVHAHQCDVRDPEACRELISRIENEQGRLDVLVCNAGMSMRGTIEACTPEVIQIMADINYLGAAYMAHFACGLLKASRGSVIFVSTLASLHGLPAMGPYGASKAALRAFSQSLRSELASWGVHVGLVHVGFTENDPDKSVYRSDGSLATIDRRHHAQSQTQTASCIVSCILHRRREMVLTRLGAAADLIYRLFPKLSDALILRYTRRNTDMYRTAE